MADVTLGVALKEWESIRRALAGGRQSLLFRKGGIHDPGGEFRVEHERFWVYPTLFHQGDPRPSDEVVLDTFAEVVAVRHVDELSTLERLAGLHAWKPGDVTKRFHYRTPGLFVLTVRVYRAEPHRVRETPDYAGCKSWVTLDEPLAVYDAVPALSDAAFAEERGRIEAALGRR